MLPFKHHSNSDDYLAYVEMLNQSVPNIWHFAMTCAQQISSKTRRPGEAFAEKVDDSRLPPESMVILALARGRGTIELKVDKSAFDSDSRLLTVFVENDEEHWHACRVNGDLRKNIRYIEGFATLCELGLVMHHVGSEFSLTQRGFELAERIEEQAIEKELVLIGVELTP